MLQNNMSSKNKSSTRFLRLYQNLNATWYEAINNGLPIDTKPYFGRVARESEWALSACF